MAFRERSKVSFSQIIFKTLKNKNFDLILEENQEEIETILRRRYIRNFIDKFKNVIPQELKEDRLFKQKYQPLSGQAKLDIIKGKLGILKDDSKEEKNHI